VNQRRVAATRIKTKRRWIWSLGPALKNNELYDILNEFTWVCHVFKIWKLANLQILIGEQTAHPHRNQFRPSEERNLSGKNAQRKNWGNRIAPASWEGSLIEDTGGGGIAGERGKERGWTNLIHLPYSPWLGAAAALWRTTHRICHQNLGELREENRSLLFQSRCNQRRGAATARPRAAVSLSAPPGNNSRLPRREEYEPKTKVIKVIVTGVCFRRANMLIIAAYSWKIILRTKCKFLKDLTTKYRVVRC